MASSGTRSKMPRETRAAAERRLLQFLCDGAADAAARRELTCALEKYSWSEPDHLVFFECIRQLCARDAQRTVENLPAALTRRGFPDMPYEALRSPSGLNVAEARALAKSLVHPAK